MIGPRGKTGLEKAIGKAPSEPGVYLIRNAAGNMLYIGKAKSLRNRVRSYLDPRRQGLKTELMIREAEDMEFLVADSELEALILENSLIKKWKPKYNITLRDDKTYPFLRLSVQEKFPTLTVVRRHADDGARYFGPYVPAGAMRRTVELIRRLFPLRQCRKDLGGRRHRPCLNAQMGRCLAPCAGRVSRESYRKIVDDVSLFLRGGGRELAVQVRREMRHHAGERRYEEAAVLRDRAAAIESTLERQKVHIPGRGDVDILGSVTLGERTAIAVLHGNHGQIVGVRSFVFDHQPGFESDRNGLGSFLRAFYDRAATIPPQILLPFEPPGKEALLEWLRRRRGGAAALRVPRTGPMRSLVTMASRNALRALESEKALPGEAGALMEELARAAGSGKTLRSLAAVDVSTLSGSDTAASLVWWQEGRFRKKNYRRFRMRSPGRADDYAMIAEAAGRLAGRVREGEWQEPDVLLLDGGRGQLSSGAASLRERGWQPKLLLAIAKPREGRALDTVFRGGGGKALDLKEGAPVLKLLQQARDEAHRFAVDYHRTLRRGRTRRSALDGVSGLGPSRKRRLLKAFGSVKILRKADLDEIAAVPGVPRTVAERLYRHLREERDA
jgi:excinuclease ABC subunit C